ncbi:MAG: hypothetical protein LBU37_12705 [Tannerellaceae bacterium]|nr:hypothetical protein [Tannerellaceae bacterium]
MELQLVFITVACRMKRSDVNGSSFRKICKPLPESCHLRPDTRLSL